MKINFKRYIPKLAHFFILFISLINIKTNQLSAEDSYLKDIEIDSSTLLSVIGRAEKSGKIYNFAHKNFYVIPRYNRSRLYALAVYFLGEEIKNAKTKMERWL